MRKKNKKSCFWAARVWVQSVAVWKRKYFSLYQRKGVCVCVCVTGRERERVTWLPTYPQLWGISSHPEAEWQYWPIQHFCFQILNHTHKGTETSPTMAQIHTELTSHIINPYAILVLTWSQGNCRETLIINTTEYYFMATAYYHSPQRKVHPTRVRQRGFQITCISWH